MLNERNQKLSKRFGDVSVESFREKGYEPEALVNAMALCGWAPPHREDENILSLELAEFMKYEVYELDDLEFFFDLRKVGRVPT